MCKVDFSFRTEAAINGEVFAHDLENLAIEHDIELPKLKRILNALFSIDYKRVNRYEVENETIVEEEIVYAEVIVDEAQKFLS